jgi:hypothetical protein
MRRWCATLTLGALLALPLYAQQKDATSDSNNGTTDTTAAPAPAPSEYNIAPASRNMFAMPAAPAPTPDIFSDWANNPWNRHAWGLLTPRYEIAGLFSYINFNPGGGFKSWNNYGATGSFAYNVNKWLGLVAEVGGYSFKRQVFVTDSSGNVTLSGVSGSQQTYLFGPRVNFRHFDHFVPFAEILFGAGHAGLQLTGDQGGQGTFALAAGGGVDVIFTKYFAWRFFQADYLMTNYSGTNLGADARQNSFRIGSGIVLRWGYPPEPPKPNHPPVAACSADKPSVYQGSTDAVGIHVNASDADNDPLTYSYSTTGGQISGNGPTAQFDSTGLAAGSYTVTCTADDGQGGRTSATTTVDVQQPAPPPQATKVGDCGYTKVGAGRFDNACKRVGDDVALRLKSDPNAKVVIVGFADPKEPKAAKLAETRAEGAKKYLGEKGIDASRISTRVGTASTEKGSEKDNRRVDFILVPEGATY